MGGRSSFLAVFGITTVLPGLAALVTCFLSVTLTNLAFGCCKREELPPTITRQNTGSSRGSEWSRGKTMSVNERRDSTDWNKIASAACSWIFTTYLILRCVLSTIIFSDLVSSKRHPSKRLDIIHQESYFKVSISLLLGTIAFGYATLSIICFERAVSVFSNSAYRLSDCTMRVIRWTVTLAGLFAVVGFVCYLWLPMIPAGPLIIPSGLVYPCTLLFTTWKFFDTTRKIAASMTDVFGSHSDNESVMTKVRDLLSGSLRLTLLSLSVILSSILVLLFTLIYGYTENTLTLLMMHSSVSFDLIINCYALLCSYHDFEYYYMRVFGTLHHYWMAKLVPR